MFAVAGTSLAAELQPAPLVTSLAVGMEAALGQAGVVASVATLGCVPVMVPRMARQAAPVVRRAVGRWLPLHRPRQAAQVPTTMPREAARLVPLPRTEPHPAEPVAPKPVVVLRAPEVQCEACLALAAGQAPPGELTHVTLHLYRKALALQTVQVGDDATLKFTSLWPFAVQLKKDF